MLCVMTGNREHRPTVFVDPGKDGPSSAVLPPGDHYLTYSITFGVRFEIVEAML
jgi:hypothetical protein